MRGGGVRERGFGTQNCVFNLLFIQAVFCVSLAYL